MIITLDGPAGVGKSTVATILAHKLNLPYLNTGAMFRCLALAVGDELDELTPAELSARCASFKFDLEGSGHASRLLCNGKLAGDEIRTEKIASLASKLGLRPEIRSCLLQKQRDIGKTTSLVAEGRDMGTLVFPSAEHKFFLDADAATRARRRWLELGAKADTPSLAEIEAAIRKRDEQDRNRPIAPLKPAADALLIDTSKLAINEVVEMILQKIKE